MTWEFFKRAPTKMWESRPRAAGTDPGTNQVVVCERCGSGFHSARAERLELCPRCLLRDDVAVRLRPAGTPPGARGKPPGGPPGRIGARGAALDSAGPVERGH